MVSNMFMTFAWYAHLRNLGGRPWYIAAIASWGVALLEYLFQVPANRIGYTALSLGQLKILQEVITLAVFVPFAVVYMRQDCHVCRSEGFSAHARIKVSSGDRTIIATLGQITGDLLKPGEASLSESAWRRLEVNEGDEIGLAHAPAVDSLAHVRAKIHGQTLAEPALSEIMRDIVAGRYFVRGLMAGAVKG